VEEDVLSPQTLCLRAFFPAAEATFVACLDFASDLYRVFGFEKFRVELSVRGGDSGQHYLGRDEDWEGAETALVAALTERHVPYQRMEGEAAFYGPKIDIKVEDAIGRP